MDSTTVTIIIHSGTLQASLPLLNCNVNYKLYGTIYLLDVMTLPLLHTFTTSHAHMYTF